VNEEELMGFRVTVWIGIVSMAIAVPSLFAQDVSVSEQIKYRKWDFTSTIGLLATSKRDFGESQPCQCEGALAWNVDAGRYFTTHLKGEAGLMLSTSRQVRDYSGGDWRFGYTVIDRNVRPTSISAALTYQFFENVFAHPYLSGGIRITVLAEDYKTSTYSTSNYSFTETSRGRHISGQVRPFVAAGFKSYFNERVYLRPELLFAMDSHGLSHGTGRIGVGFDF
jgi:hypothetical protein